MGETQDFPWTFDQFQRYAVLKEGLRFFYEGKNPVVLDVGGVTPLRRGESPGLSLEGIFAGESYTLDLVFCPEPGFIQGNGISMPFKEEKFDMVSALDVIEHVPPESRETFLRELCRVSRDLVLVSSPFPDENVKKAESMLYDQVKHLYGLTHQQLEEHRRFGLPESGMVAAVLEKAGFSQVGFPYGSLESWIFFQTLKHCFLFRYGAEEVNKVIDWFEIKSLKEAEFHPPFSRHFWIASRSRSEEELKQGVAQMLAWLRAWKEEPGEGGEPSLARLEKFHRGLIRLFFPESVSAVVVAEAGGGKLTRCLQHVLTQKVDFDLHVSVWNVGGSPEVERTVKDGFPGVSYFDGDKSAGKSFREKALEVFCRLKGDHVLLLDEDVLLPQESVRTFYERMREQREGMLLTPDVVDAEGKSLVRLDPAGVRTGCLFMRRKALSEVVWNENLMLRKLADMEKRDFFLWETGGEKIKVLFLEEFKVWKV